VKIRKKKGAKKMRWWNWMDTNPVSVRTSLVILIFFLHPKHKSSRVHSSFLSIGGGFSIPDEFEYMIGLLLLLLAFLEFR